MCIQVFYINNIIHEPVSVSGLKIMAEILETLAGIFADPRRQNYIFA